MTTDNTPDQYLLKLTFDLDQANTNTRSGSLGNQLFKIVDGAQKPVPTPGTHTFRAGSKVSLVVINAAKAPLPNCILTVTFDFRKTTEGKVRYGSNPFMENPGESACTFALEASGTPGQWVPADAMDHPEHLGETLSRNLVNPKDNTSAVSWDFDIYLEIFNQADGSMTKFTVDPEMIVDPWG